MAEMLLHCYIELASCRTAGPILGDLALCQGLFGRLGTLPGTWQFARYCKRDQVKHFHILESVGSKPNTGCGIQTPSSQRREHTSPAGTNKMLLK